MSKTKSEELFERSLKIAPGGVHSPVRAFKSVEGTPTFFEWAQGAHLRSVDGALFIDYCQSFGPLILGHRDPEVSEIVTETINRAWTFGTCEPYSLELAEWITGHLPWVEKIRFVCSGTEAVMTALRIARAATGRNRILKFDGCYHGHVDSMLVKAGSGLAGEAVSDSAGVSQQQAQDTIVCPLDNDEELELIFKNHGSEIAAVIVEPLPANYGLLIQRKEFIQKMANLAKANGCLLIFDEVISGFRVALGGMAEVLNIKPDLVTYGKVIGGGFPVGAYGGRRDLMNLVAPQGPVYQAGTLSASPVGMRAGLATLKKVVRDGVYGVLNGRTENFAAQLNAIMNLGSRPLVVSHVASIFWIHSPTAAPAHRAIRAVSQIPAEHKKTFNVLFHKLMGEGIYLAPSGFEVGFMSLAHNDAVIEKTLKAFERVFAQP